MGSLHFVITKLGHELKINHNLTRLKFAYFLDTKKEKFNMSGKGNGYYSGTNRQGNSYTNYGGDRYRYSNTGENGAGKSSYYQNGNSSFTRNEGGTFYRNENTTGGQWTKK